MSDPGTEEASLPRFDPSQMLERNLERALLDFELANARVLDLTQRLISLTSELVSTREHLEEARLRISRMEAERSQVEAEKSAAVFENSQIKSSLAYRGLRVMGDARAHLRR